MKAAFIEQYGGPEVLKFGDLPDPVVATPRSNSPTVSGRGHTPSWDQALSPVWGRWRPSTERVAPFQGQARIPGGL